VRSEGGAALSIRAQACAAVAQGPSRQGGDRLRENTLEKPHGPIVAWFPSTKHLCSWAKVSPGNNESAGKRKSGRTGKGNKWLRAVLVECAHAAGHTKGTYLSTKFRRFASRKGKKRAAVMVAHRILEAAYFILRDKVPYRELGDQYLDAHHREHIIRHHVRRLESLGLHIDIRELPLTA